MQTYWAQIFLLLKKIVTMVKTVCQTFLWIGSNNCSRKELVAWDKICIAGGPSVIDRHVRMEQSSSIQTVMGTRTEALDSVGAYFLHQGQGLIYYDHTKAGLLNNKDVI